ncbi:MAG: hypothetical protein M3552_06960 [Planctomycetota bacterium]|nr:hypothetical protein [Planctomycetaceae bacterium]MDQ3330376.1 hypothetical protein [Planctomycetota bacterium]
MTVRSLLRGLLLCLLTLCVGGIGPAVLAAAPRVLNPSAEEERSATETIAIGGSASMGLRPGRASEESRRHAGAIPWFGGKPGKASPGREKVAVTSLRTLQVRIQV